ncbi:START-like domain containing protein, partial [Parasponia andersonii]
VKAVGILEASYEEIFGLVMRKMELGLSRWDCSFQYGSLVKEANGCTTISSGLGDCLKEQRLERYIM